MIRQLTNDFISSHLHGCYGCHACFNICPVQAIFMKQDAEGFLYPVINDAKCIHCGACARVCPMISRKSPINQISVAAYACMNINEQERLKSSSGGVFIEVAKYVIGHGGYVFGAAFDKDFHLIHKCAHDMAGCRAFMGSKYLQSRIGRTYQEAKTLLDAGKLVLFTGTPCQIHGLKLFLGKEYENLISLDCVCHGVPSPLVFAEYIKELKLKSDSRITSFSFRCKDNMASCMYAEKGRSINNGFCISGAIERYLPREKLVRRIRYSIERKIRSILPSGIKISNKKTIATWRKYHLRAVLDNGMILDTVYTKSLYMRGFLEDLYLRPSCYRCNNKGEYRFSDLTLADYWGVEYIDPDMDDDKGTSLIIVHTIKGENMVSTLSGSFKIKSVDIKNAMKYNPSFYKSAKVNPNRKEFFLNVRKHINTN